MAPPRCMGLLAIMPIGRPSIRSSPVIIPTPNWGFNSNQLSISARPVNQGCHLIDPLAILGDYMAQEALVWCLPVLGTALKIGRAVVWWLRRLRHHPRPIDQSNRSWPASEAGPISLGPQAPSPPPSIMAGPPMPIQEFWVAILKSQLPNTTALPAKQ